MSILGQIAEFWRGVFCTGTEDTTGSFTIEFSEKALAIMPAIDWSCLTHYTVKP